MDNGELDVAAPKPRLAEHSTDHRIVEDREHELLQLDLDRSNRDRIPLNRTQMMMMIDLRLPSLVRLRPLNRRHQRVRNRRRESIIAAAVVAVVIVVFGGREAIEGDADGEVESAELEARGEVSDRGAGGA